MSPQRGRPPVDGDGEEQAHVREKSELEPRIATVSETPRDADLLVSHLHFQLSIRMLGLLRAPDGVTEGKGQLGGGRLCSLVTDLGEETRCD